MPLGVSVANEDGSRSGLMLPRGREGHHRRVVARPFLAARSRAADRLKVEVRAAAERCTGMVEAHRVHDFVVGDGDDPGIAVDARLEPRRVVRQADAAGVSADARVTDGRFRWKHAEEGHDDPAWLRRARVSARLERRNGEASGREFGNAVQDHAANAGEDLRRHGFARVVGHGPHVETWRGRPRVRRRQRPRTVEAVSRELPVEIERKGWASRMIFRATPSRAPSTFKWDICVRCCGADNSYWTWPAGSPVIKLAVRIRDDGRAVGLQPRAGNRDAILVANDNSGDDAVAQRAPP